MIIMQGRTSVVVETTCFETKIETAKFSQDQDRSFFETFGSRPGIIETGNYLASKNKFISPGLINLFLFFQKITIQVNKDF